MRDLQISARAPARAIAPIPAELPALRGAAGAAQGALGGDSKGKKCAGQGGGAGADRSGAKERAASVSGGGGHRVAKRPAWLADRLANVGLDRVRSQIEVCADDDCWLWRGPMLRGLARIGFSSARENLYFDARRLVWELTHGWCPPPTKSPRCACNGLCVHPDHLRLVNRSSEPAHRAVWRKRLVAAQEARSPITLDIARAIRASSERLIDVAARYGCCPATASKIRRGLVWREPDHAFAGMGEGWRA